MASTEAALLPDTRLPHLESLWSPSLRIELLKRRVLPQLFPDDEALDSEIRHLTYRPGRQCIAWLGLDLASGRKRSLVMTFVKDERFDDAFARHYGEPATDGRPRAVYLRDLRCLVERFPADWQLPSLERLLRQGGLGRGTASDEDDTPAGFELITYRPHEACVLQSLNAGAGEPYVIKVLEDKERAAHLVRISQLLARQLRHPAVWTPDAHLLAGDPHVVVMQRARGPSLHQALAEATDNAARRSLMELAASALAELHRLPPSGYVRRPLSLTAGLEHTRKRCQRMELSYPALGAEARSILDAIEPCIADAAEACFLHADYKGTQLLLADGRIAVIDLDSASQGDPAVDVGNFLADLRRETVLAGQGDAPDLSDCFLEAYVAESDHRSIVERALVYRVVALVRMAAHSFRQQAYAWRDGEAFRPYLLLREARRCLEFL